jgi:hypothetical protein
VTCGVLTHTQQGTPQESSPLLPGASGGGLYEHRAALQPELFCNRTAASVSCQPEYAHTASLPQWDCGSRSLTGSRDTHLGRSAATTACVNAHGSSKCRRLIVACSTRDGEGKGRHPKFRAGPRGRGGPLAPTLAAGVPEQHCDAPALLAARHHVQPTRAAAVIIPVGVRDVHALSLRPSQDDALP